MRIEVCLIAVAALAQSGMREEMLAAHNAARAKVGTPALVWSDDLARAAQEWADRLIAEKRFDHRPKSKYGENMFEARGAQSTAAKVVERWMSEASNFDPKTNKCRGVCGHYTQVVWRQTKEVGCAVSRGAGREVWVCEYAPPGNYVGMRPY